MVARATVHLLDGDALAAMRTLRAAQQLSELDSRLRIKRELENRQRHELDTAQRDLTARSAELDHREHVLRAEDERLRNERENLKKTAATLDALYEMLYESPPSGGDGPAPAKADPTNSGIGPAQTQLNTACGDATTTLPSGMTIPACGNNQ